QKNLEEFVEEHNLSLPELALSSKLAEFRQQQDRNHLDIAQFEAFSDHFIYTFLARIEENAKTFKDVDIRRKLMGFKDLVDSKIYLGKTRSVLMKVIQENKFSYRDYAIFSIDKDFFDKSLQSFIRYASAESSREILELTTSDNHKQILNLFTLFENNPQIDLTPYNQRAVYNLFTNSVADFRNAEALLIAGIKNEVQDQSSAKEAAFSSLII